jgi:hypothetical protein
MKTSSADERRGGCVPETPFLKTGGAAFLAAQIICCLLSGCVARLPVGDCSITADIACEIAYELIRLEAKPDTPDTGDKCTNCNGTGKVGDGRVAVKCAACDGTGKKKTQKVLSYSKPTCANGVCLQ